MSEKYDFFWTTMELCDWKKEGDDDEVLKPVIKYLAEQSDHIIFEFDDLMTELLYHLDTENEYPHTSPLSYETGSNKDGWGK